MDLSSIGRLRDGIAEAQNRCLLDLCVQKGFLNRLAADRILSSFPENITEELRKIVPSDTLRKLLQDEAEPVEVMESRRLPERQVSKYVLVRLLGHGGMGEVWKAWDTRLGRWVALKLLKNADPEEIPRLLREAALASKATHPNIAAIYEASDEPPKPFIAMRYVDGQTLAEKLQKNGSLFPRKALDTIRKIALALHVMHRQGIIHRDIKPSNIIVDEQDEPHLLDFGIARRVHQPGTFTAKGIVVGTPPFMSPEHVQMKSLDARSDVFSLGATLYTLLVGAPAFFHPNPLEAMQKVVHQELPPLRGKCSGMDADLELLIRKAMEKDPDLRYPSAQAMAEDIERYLNHQPLLAGPTSPLVRLRRRLALNRRMVWMFAAIAVLTFATVIGIGLMVVGVKGVEADLAQIERRMGELVKKGLRQEKIVADLAELERECTALTEKAPRLWKGHYRRGIICGLLGRWAEAEESFIRAADCDPQAGAPVMARAEIFLYRHFQDLPFPLVRKEKSSMNCFHYPLEQSRSWPFWQEARRLTARALELGVDSHDVLFVQALRLYEAGRYAEARAGLTVVREGSAFHPTAYLFHGECTLRLGEAGPALDDFAKARLFGISVEVSLIWGAVSRALKGDADRAIQDCAEVLRMNPRSSKTYVLRGMLRALTADYRGGIFDAEEALKMDPKTGEAYWLRGECRLKRNEEITAAIADLEQAQKLASYLEPLIKNSLTSAREK